MDPWAEIAEEYSVQGSIITQEDESSSAVLKHKQTGEKFELLVFPRNEQGREIYTGLMNISHPRLIKIFAVKSTPEKYFLIQE